MQVITNLFRAIFTKYASKVAIDDCTKKRTFSYGEVEDLSSKFAYLLRQKVKANDHVALVLSNSTEMIIAYLACMQARLVSVPINPDFHLGEIQTILEMTAPTLILTDMQVIQKLPHHTLCPVLRLGDSGADYSLSDIGRMPRFEYNLFPQTQDEDLAHIVLSSGTSGLPKAIPIRFGHIIGHATMFVESHGLDASCRFYSVLPLAYLGGWYNLTLVPFLSGGTIILDRLFGANRMYRYWNTLQEYNINCVWYTPSMLSALLSIGLEEPGQRDIIRNQICWGMVGMAPLLPDLKKRFEETFGFRLQQSYGLSETFLFTSWMSDISLPDASVGKCLKGYTIKIMDLSGEIRVKGKCIFDGYWHQEQLTANAFDEEGYFKTGDAGYFDGEGNLYITGRLKDIIIRSGINISPAEIENVLYRMEGVRDAAVIGIPHTVYGETIVAFLTCSKTPVSSEDALTFCRQHLTTIKVPSSIVIVNSMPLNASGKIDKKALKERFLHAQSDS